MFEVNKSIGYLLAMAAKKVSSRFKELMEENDIDFGHAGWIVLSRLWEEDGLSQQEISDRSNVSKPNISTYAQKLEQDNYIVRTPDPVDSRSNKLFLTQKGKQFKDLCQSLARQANDELLAPLTNQEKEIFHQCLKKINRH